MNRAYRIVPTPTGDVSGVASALYELGGMVVIHDPSGCNSTYNTHDEIRWYEKDSLIFISGLSQTDAIMGDDEKLIREIEEAARSLKPRFIALASSPIPYMNGTDFEAIARILEEDLEIPVFFVQTNGMHDYTVGAGNALCMVAKRLLPKSSDSCTEIPFEPQIRVNILGMTPLDFAAGDSAKALQNLLLDAGFLVQSCWAMGDSLEVLQTSMQADVNLVISAVGLKAAKELKRRFGIPYVIGCPIGAFAGQVLEALRSSAEDGSDRNVLLSEEKLSKEKCSEEKQSKEKRSEEIRSKEKFSMENLSIEKLSQENPEAQGDNQKKILLIGEPVTHISLARAIECETGRETSVICPLEVSPELLRSQDYLADGEEEIEALLSEAARNGAIRVIADPLYRPILPKGALLIENPSLSISGRCFLGSCRNYFLTTPQDRNLFG